jgi:hypothetical protein
MPININQGNVPTFTVEFLDSNSNITVPSSGTITLNYVTSSGFSTSTSIGLTLANPKVFTATWDSTPARLGLVTYAITVDAPLPWRRGCYQPSAGPDAGVIEAP